MCRRMELLLQVQRAPAATLLLVAVSSMLALGAGHLQARSALSEETGTSFGCPAAAQLICTRQAATRELLEEAPGGKPICCLHTQDGEEGAALPLLPQGAQGVAVAGRRRQGLPPHQTPSLLPSLPTPGLLSHTTSFSLVIHSCSPARMQSQTSQQRWLSCPCSHVPLYPLSCSSCKVSAQLLWRNNKIVPPRSVVSLQESRVVQGYSCFNKKQ